MALQQHSVDRIFFACCCFVLIARTTAKFFIPMVVSPYSAMRWHAGKNTSNTWLDSLFEVLFFDTKFQNYVFAKFDRRRTDVLHVFTEPVLI